LCEKGTLPKLSETSGSNVLSLLTQIRLDSWPIRNGRLGNAIAWYFKKPVEDITHKKGTKHYHQNYAYWHRDHSHHLNCLHKHKLILIVIYTKRIIYCKYFDCSITLSSTGLYHKSDLTLVRENLFIVKSFILNYHSKSCYNIHIQNCLLDSYD